MVNAFAYVNQHFFGGNGTADITMTLDANGNTRITYTGSHPILPFYTFDYGGTPNGLPHFGYDGLGASEVIEQFWKEGCATFCFDTDLPALSVTGPPLLGQLIAYATLFADITCNGQTVGQWVEVPFNTNTSPMLVLTNPTQCIETLSDVGFLITATHIPLDNLNFGTLPPPGEPGSMFTPLMELDGQFLQSGGSHLVTLPVATLPEPSTWLLLATGLVGLLGYGWRRQRAA